LVLGSYLVVLLGLIHWVGLVAGFLQDTLPIPALPIGLGAGIGSYHLEVLVEVLVASAAAALAVAVGSTAVSSCPTVLCLVTVAMRSVLVLLGLGWRAVG
jgi:hypothetical protein